MPDLMWRLSSLFDGAPISFDRSHNEVRVESEWESRAATLKLQPNDLRLARRDLPGSAGQPRAGWPVSAYQ